MTKGSLKKIWISCYIFFNKNIYTETGDQTILNIVRPIVSETKNKQWFDKFFFIRYSENGSHIRLRFYGNSNILNQKLKPFIEKFVNSSENIEFLSYSKNLDEQIKIKSHLLWVDYEPEIERYGGLKAIEIAEDIFESSSKIAFELLENVPHSQTDRSTRLGKGLLTTLVFLHSFLEDKNLAVNFSEQYSIGYLTSISFNTKEAKINLQESFKNGLDKQSRQIIDNINLIWESLENNNSIDPSLDIYKMELMNKKNELQRLVYDENVQKRNIIINNWVKFVILIGSSYLHMTNNRLGISIQEESYLTYLISKCMINNN